MPQMEDIEVGDRVRIDLPCWVYVTGIKEAEDKSVHRGNLVVTFEGAVAATDAGVVRIGSKVNVDMIAGK